MAKDLAAVQADLHQAQDREAHHPVQDPEAHHPVQAPEAHHQTPIRATRHRSRLRASEAPGLPRAVRPTIAWPTKASASKKVLPAIGPHRM